jgi:hypothetical protein
MIIKAIILSTLLTNEPVIMAMPPSSKIEAKRRYNKGRRDRRRGGGGLR